MARATAITSSRKRLCPLFTTLRMGSPTNSVTDTVMAVAWVYTDAR
jgi:hypothetical protein